MPKQVIVIMDQNYPFGECEECTTDKIRVLVRKIEEVGVEERNKLLDKIGIHRKLRNQHLIKIQSVLEEEESVHILFEYIPIKLETWISNINDQFIENFRDQLIKFSSFLANNFIEIEFQLKNIGMDQNYGAKYFLPLNFETNPNLNREKLKSTYIRQITNLFKPYILHAEKEIQAEITPPTQHEQPSKIETSHRVQSHGGKLNQNSISPPTNKITTKHKEKALQKYYQEVNMSIDSENEKILQQFMDVLDNEEQQIDGKFETHPKEQQNAKKVEKRETQPKIHFQQEQQQETNYESIHKQSTSSYQQSQHPKQHQYPQPQQRPYQASSNVNKIHQPTYNEESWKNCEELQKRVKHAIQKSLVVIKKFRAIKDSSMM